MFLPSNHKCCLWRNNLGLFFTFLQSDLTTLLKPMSDQIAVIQGVRDKNRGNEYFNHLSTINEGISAFGWVAVVSWRLINVKQSCEWDSHVIVSETVICVWDSHCVCVCLSDSQHCNVVCGWDLCVKGSYQCETVLRVSCVCVRQSWQHS